MNAGAGVRTGRNPRKNQGFYHAGTTPRGRELAGAGERRGSGAGGEKARRILRRAAVANLEVQVRAGGAAGIACERDAPAAQHDVALLDEELREMRVARDEVVAVVEVD